MGDSLSHLDDLLLRMERNHRLHLPCVPNSTIRGKTKRSINAIHKMNASFIFETVKW